MLQLLHSSCHLLSLCDSCQLLTLRLLLLLQLNLRWLLHYWWPLVGYLCRNLLLDLGLLSSKLRVLSSDHCCQLLLLLLLCLRGSTNRLRLIGLCDNCHLVLWLLSLCHSCLLLLDHALVGRLLL